MYAKSQKYDMICLLSPRSSWLAI